MKASGSPTPRPTGMPLKRFAPTNKSSGSAKQRTGMTSSFSVPFLSGLSDPDEPRKSRVPVRKERQKVSIEMTRDNRSMANMRAGAGEVFTPMVETDLTEGEESYAVSLPLAPIESQTKPIQSILDDKNGETKVILMQLPSTLPIKYPNNTTQMDSNPLQGVTDGYLGKVQLHESGRVTCQIGNVTFELVSGTFGSGSQMFFYIDEKEGFKYIPFSGEKAVLTVDLDKMFEDIDNEVDEDEAVKV